MSDRHLRRTGSDYREAFLELLPQGEAWPKHAIDSVLWQACDGLNQYWGYVDGNAADLLEIESNPGTTVALLPDWERNWGLPDPCYSAPQTIAQRQTALIARMTLWGSQSREWYINFAKFLGYDITITEYRPFMVGIDRCGDNRVYGNGTYMQDQWGRPVLNPQGTPLAQNELSEWPNYGLGPPENRYYWTVHVSAKSLEWFRCGSGQCGVDPHLRIGVPQDLQCILARWKPAHTQIIFDFGGVQGVVLLEGTDTAAGQGGIIGLAAIGNAQPVEARDTISNVGNLGMSGNGTGADTRDTMAGSGGVVVVQNPVTIYQPTVPFDFDSGEPNRPMRMSLRLSGPSQGLIRVKWHGNDTTGAGGTGATDFAHMGIGKWDGTANYPNTTATPIEITFNNGQHGLNLAVGAAPVYSDWIDVSSLVLNNGDTAIVTWDNGPIGGHRGSRGSANSAMGVSNQNPGWNDITTYGSISDFDHGQNNALGIEEIQTVAPAGGTTPTITNISPVGGVPAGGTSVIITGTNFAGATAVKFGATNATSFTVNSGTQITAVAPAGTGGSQVDVTVTTPQGTTATSASTKYTYVLTPTVSSISPTSGSASGGTTVTVTGTNFTGATAVKFGTANAASFTVVSATSVSAVSPASTGTQHITVTNAQGTSPTSANDQFTFVASGLPPVTINAQPKWDFNYGSQETPALNPFYTGINPWNTGSYVRGVDYTTSITNYPSTFPAGTVFNWSYPNVNASGMVYSFDLIGWGIYGYYKPNYNPVVGVTLNNVTVLRVQHDFTYSGSIQDYHVCYDWFTTLTAGYSGSNQGNEFLVIVSTVPDYDKNYLDGSWTQAQRYKWTDFNGIQWQMFDKQGGNFIRICRVDWQEAKNVTLDFKQMMDVAVANGQCPASHYFVGFALGIEPAKNGGQMVLNSMSVVYNHN